MGEIADMILEGGLCEFCGVYLDGTSPGFTRQCASCSRPENKKNDKPKPKPKKKKT